MTYKFHHPDPNGKYGPSTKGVHPDQWPTAATIPDAQLQDLLDKYTRVDITDRGRQKLGNRERHALNTLIHELQTEALKRGLPVELGHPE